MSPIRIRVRLESDTPHLPELRPLIGKNVEILVREEEASVAPEGNPYEAFLALAGQDVVDPDALQRLRAASKI